MAGQVVRPVAPHIGAQRKRRIGPRVPGPQRRARQHAPGIDVRRRIVGRIGPVAQHRPQRLPLRQRIGGPGREIRPAALAALGIGKQIRLVGALVDGAAAELREPDRLPPGHPRRRRRRTHPARPVVMGIAPPAHEVLVSPHPGFAIGAVGDRRARSRAAVLVGGVVPVEALAAGDIGAQIAEIVRPVPRRRVRPVLAAPVGERHVVVDAHRIDIGRGPQRIEMEEFLAAARLHAGIFAPVRGIGQHRRRQQRPRLGGETHQRRNERESVRRPARKTQPAQLRADDEAVDPRRRAEPGIVQHEIAIARRERRDLARRRGRPLRGRQYRDPPAPRIGRLAQRIVLGNIQQQQRIERHPEPARPEVGDRRQHRGVGRRAAIGWAAIVRRHHADVAAPQPRHRPFGADHLAHRRLHLGRDRAGAAAQIVAEPGDHQRHLLEVGAERRQLVERQRPVGDARRLVRILRHRRAGPEQPHARRRVVAELRRAGDHRHRRHQRLEFAHHAAELHTDVGDAVAEGGQRQALEHQIAEAPISRRIGALLGLDQAVGRLRLAAAIKAPGHPGQVHQLAVGPDAAEPRHLALAQPEGEIGADGRLGVLAVVAATDALGAAALGLDALEFRGPDDVAAEPGPAIKLGDRRALARAVQPEVGAGHRCRLRPVGKDRAVDGAAGERAQRPPHGGADRPAHRTADKLSGQRKRQGRHQIVTPGKS